MNEAANAGNGGAAVGGGATAGAGAAASVAAGGAGAAAAGAAAPWYGDKIDEVTRGFWSNKGIDPNDPIQVATKLTDFYRQAEQRIGAPPEELLRIPRPNAPEADINAYWGRIGVPAKAEDYDLSAVKFADGSELDTAFADAFRAAALAARVPKDRAADLLARLVKHDEGVETASKAERTAHINEQREALKQNWGQNYAYNEQIAKRTLGDLGRLAGLTAEQTTAAWDALSTVGGIGSSFAMEMLRFIGSRMNTSPNGEPQFVSAQNPGAPKAMSQAEAKARIEELKVDKSFYKRLVTDKEAAAKREWDDLHKIAFRAA